MCARRGSDRKNLRRLAGVAYERELSTELKKLHDQFHDWLEDRLDTFALSDAVHEFHDGAARNLYAFYTYSKAEIQVARAVAHGVLSRDEVPEPILEGLRSLIEFFEEDSEGEMEGEAV